VGHFGVRHFGVMDCTRKCAELQISPNITNVERIECLKIDISLFLAKMTHLLHYAPYVNIYGALCPNVMIAHF